jgi:hypothetical protein
MAVMICPTCSKRYSVSDALVGRSMTCRDCRSILVSETPSPRPAVPAPGHDPFITFACGSCGITLKVPGTQGGKTGKCPKCQADLVVPVAAAFAGRPPLPTPAPVIMPPQPSTPASYQVSLTDDDSISPPVSPAVHLGAANPGAWSSGRDGMSPPSLANGRSGQMSARPYVVLGILLLLGFLLPIVYSRYNFGSGSSQSVEFINFTGLGEPDVPVVIKIMLLYPALAGIAVLCVGLAVRGIGRGIPMMCIGMLPMLILMGDQDVRFLFRSLPQELIGTGVAVIFALLGWLGLFAGGLALRYQNTYRAAAITAGVGGGLYLLHLLIPVTTSEFRGRMTIPLIQPFLLLAELSKARGSGAASLVLFVVFQIAQMGLLIAASIVALRFTFISDLRHRATRLTFMLVLGALACAVLGILVVLFASLSNASSREVAEVVPTILTTLLKMGCWIGGLMFLVPFGLADLLLAVNPWRQEPQGFPVATASLD